MKKITQDDLICMAGYLQREPIAIDLVYADGDHPENIFGQALYRKEAQFWAHKELAPIILEVARSLNKQQKWILELKDCLRTVEGQQAMNDTKIVQDHPEWTQDGPNRMVSPPGQGAHPRGMAVDVSLLDENGERVDLGTPFDFMGPESHRDYDGLSADILWRRRLLESAFIDVAKKRALAFLPYPAEWWDFRFKKEVYDQYAPLSDADLPDVMRMT